MPSIRILNTSSPVSHIAKYYNTKYFRPGSDVLWPQLPNQQQRVSFLQREHHFWSNAYCLRAQVLFWTFIAILFSFVSCLHCCLSFSCFLPFLHSFLFCLQRFLHLLVLSLSILFLSQEAPPPPNTKMTKITTLARYEYSQSSHNRGRHSG